MQDFCMKNKIVVRSRSRQRSRILEREGAVSNADAALVWRMYWQRFGVQLRRESFYIVSGQWQSIWNIGWEQNKLCRSLECFDKFHSCILCLWKKTRTKLNLFLLYSEIQTEVVRSPWFLRSKFFVFHRRGKHWWINRRLFSNILKKERLIYPDEVDRSEMIDSDNIRSRENFHFESDLSVQTTEIVFKNIYSSTSSSDWLKISKTIVWQSLM